MEQVASDEREDCQPNTSVLARQTGLQCLIGLRHACHSPPEQLTVIVYARRFAVNVYVERAAGICRATAKPLGNAPPPMLSTLVFKIECCTARAGRRCTGFAG